MASHNDTWQIPTDALQSPMVEEHPIKLFEKTAKRKNERILHEKQRLATKMESYSAEKNIAICRIKIEAKHIQNNYMCVERPLREGKWIFQFMQKC